MCPKPQVNSVLSIAKAKPEGRKLSMVTCYDATFARLIEQSSIDMVLVGDSLGTVMLGYKSSLQVTLDDMVHHAAAVSRVIKRPLLCVDMPFMTYHSSREQALENASVLVQKGGAHCVKLEGGQRICSQVDSLVSAGIPVVGHIGLTPQSVNTLGGFRVQGRSDEDRKRIIEDALSLEQAGAFALVLELVPADLAREISRRLTIPTIGIGAGIDCDGQVLVLQDLLGLDQDFSPKFLKKYANAASLVHECLDQFDRDVKELRFPAVENSY